MWQRRQFAVVGVIVMIAALGAGAAYLSFRDQRYTTQVGGLERVVLKDSSLLELNTDSVVEVKYRWSLRTVELLRGEASFRVAHDPKRPFVVVAGNTAVRAMGTRFTVHRLPRAIEVFVIEGTVAVGPTMALGRSGTWLPASIPRVNAKQLAVADAGGLTLERLSEPQIERKLAWKAGRLAFAATPLAEAIAQFNRYNLRKLAIGSPELATLAVDGSFAATNVDGFVSALRARYGVHAAEHGGRITLLAAQP